MSLNKPPRHLNVATNVLQRSKSTHATSPAPARRGLSMTRDASITSIGIPIGDVDHDPMALPDDDPVHLMLKEKWSQSESAIAALFTDPTNTPPPQLEHDRPYVDPALALQQQQHDAPPPAVRPDPTPKRPVRTIDEDDYGDDEDEEDEEGEGEGAVSAVAESPLIAKEKTLQSNGYSRPVGRSPSLGLKPITTRTSTSSSSDHGKSSEDVRKKLEEDKRATEEAAKRSFHTMFYTLESDRDAMLEQQKLDELDRQVENEMSNGAGHASGTGATGGQVQGSLSNADLGASSLTLKNLIARIDAKRHMVNANDTQLRTLISEVRKGRSKWASEEKVGQEELYEAAEKVLMELKAMTEWSTPFLQRVNKRDAQDYFHIVKHPMDIGSMIKKLKSFAYKSKKEFVGDLSLIWSNCLLYNADPNHPLRKKALYMRKETDKLVPLIPDVVVRDRADVEAEERRLQNLDVDLEGGEDSDDGKRTSLKSTITTTNSLQTNPSWLLAVARHQAKARRAVTVPNVEHRQEIMRLHQVPRQSLLSTHRQRVYATSSSEQSQMHRWREAQMAFRRRLHQEHRHLLELMVLAMQT